MTNNIKKEVTSEMNEKMNEELLEMTEAIDDNELNKTNQNFTTQSGDNLPILTLRNIILIPGIYTPITIGREASLKIVQEAYDKGQEIAVACQKRRTTENPQYKDLYNVGTLARISRIVEMPDKIKSAIIEGITPITIKEITETTPYLKGNVEVIDQLMPDKEDNEFNLLLKSCFEDLQDYFNDKDVEDAFYRAYDEIEKSGEKDDLKVNFILGNLNISNEEKIKMLEIGDLKQRLYRINQVIKREISLSDLKDQIEDKVRSSIDKQQREYYLQQQMKTIQDELSEDGDGNIISELKKKAKKKKWSKEVKNIFNREVSKLQRTPQQSPDYNVQLNFLETMLKLPWNKFSKDNLDIENAEETLNSDHYGLDKVKERILEHLAVLKIKGNMKSPIICLYGPPGVGKTSLGKSVAKALNRSYVRMSLGGLHDEAEIRGHRKTYIGSMAGRIIKNIIKADSSNPVFVLDEIDKIKQDQTNGDPSSALLEVLDPEQNNKFHDNYLDVDYDLSNVLFIATANNINAIPEPLLDRMELIQVDGYITEEKIEIAKRHLIPKSLSDIGFDDSNIIFNDDAIETIIENYTRESGVRNLEKNINKILRKVARKVVSNDGIKEQIVITKASIEEYLGKSIFHRDTYQGNEYAGVVTGLAWTQYGGEILFIETSLSPSKTPGLRLTGNLGDVMKESAMLALEYIKAHSADLNIDNEIFNNWSVHVHVPEGAIPKDGPSAGITLVTALASAFTQRKVKPQIAMTGEITLRGKVLPIGGVKEKILAAKRANIKELILCEENKRDIDEIKPYYLEGLTIHYVKDIKEVLNIALEEEKVNNPINFTINQKEQNDKK